MHRPQRIVSGGQTGVDRAALEAARDVNIATGGVAPPGFRVSSGCVDLSLRDDFGLVAQEIGSGGFGAALAARTRRNIDASCATLVFRTHDSPGTRLTVAHCARTRKPCCVVPQGDEDEAMHVILAFLNEHRPRVLNVAGHRDDGTPAAVVLAARTRRLLVAALKCNS